MFSRLGTVSCKEGALKRHGAPHGAPHRRPLRCLTWGKSSRAEERAREDGANPALHRQRVVSHNISEGTKKTQNTLRRGKPTVNTSRLGGGYAVLPSWRAGQHVARPPAHAGMSGRFAHTHRCLPENMGRWGRRGGPAPHTADGRQETGPLGLRPAPGSGRAGSGLLSPQQARRHDEWGAGAEAATKSPGERDGPV